MVIGAEGASNVVPLFKDKDFCRKKNWSGVKVVFTREEATRNLWYIGRQWYTGEDLGVTVEYALYVTRNILNNPMLCGRGSLGGAARRIQEDIISHQKTPADDSDDD